MKPTDRKRLLADVTEAQDRFSLVVMSLRGVQYTITRESSENGKPQFAASNCKIALGQAVTFLQSQGWSVTDISLPDAEFPTFLVGG